MFNLSLEEGTNSSFTIERSKYFAVIYEGVEEQVKQLQTTEFNISCMQTLVRDHMVEFLEKHKLINTSQHGFLKTRSNQSLMFWGRNYKEGR